MNWNGELIGWFELPAKMKERLKPLFRRSELDDVFGGDVVFDDGNWIRTACLSGWFNAMRRYKLLTPEILNELAPYILAGNK